MSEKQIKRLLRLLVSFLLLDLCFAGPRPSHRTHQRHHKPGTRVHNKPFLNDQGQQRVHFPSLSDSGVQRIQIPSLSDLYTQRIEIPLLDDGQMNQRCARGYYKDRNGRCVSCVCNGRSEDCDERTGRCTSCEDNTAGDHCERCKDGYYGSAALGTCKICPCPFSTESNSFAAGCSEVGFGRVRCLCKPGYTGEKCERCAFGYFGRPDEYGGRCQPCNCNGNSCSPTTGACNYVQDPKDTNPSEECTECDSCAQTLLKDLEKLDGELELLKVQLDSINSSNEVQRKLKELEKAIKEAKTMVKTYRTDAGKLKPKVNELERDVRNLSLDITSLKQEAEKKSDQAQKAVKNVENTHKKAKDLNSQVLDLLKKIQELLKQLKNPSLDGSSTLPSGDADKLLREAERLVQVMQERNFKPQKEAAEKELDEAKKLLDYIKNDCTKQLKQNQEAAETIRQRLKNYEDKLKDLDEALKEAKENVQKASAQNSANDQTLNDQLKQLNALEDEKNNVENDITMAKQQLNDAENLLKMLTDSKKKYESLAAELDGAKTELTDRLNTISQTAALEGLVKKAEDHAALLNKLANELEAAIKNSSGRADVKDALAAVDAYKNITEAINNAEEAAKKAMEAAKKAMTDVTQGDIGNRAKNLKDQSSSLHKDAKRAETDLKELANDLKDKQKRLDNAQEKKTQLEKELRDLKNELNNIKRDDIAEKIDAAKKTAQAANDSAGDTLNKLKGINAEIEAIKTQGIDGASDQANINRMLNDVDMAVKNLTESIPSLLNKLTSVENLSSEIDPNNNLSYNIMHIKELIEEARKAANRVPLPMKFTGKEHVELRLPRNLDDLRAYTSMSLLLHRPQEQSGRGDGARRRRQSDNNLFVLYLGNKDTTRDYLGMALRQNVLYFVYQLNGEVKEMRMDSITLSNTDRMFFDKVDMRRIYEDTELNFTKLFTTNNPENEFQVTRRGDVFHNLLDLHPSQAVFYVAGYPKDFAPPAPLNYPGYKGCIEFNMFNERFASLYNFKSLGPENVTLETPCSRYIRPGDGDYFDGTGYLQLELELERVPRFLRIYQTIDTHAKNGIILYIGNEDVYNLISLEEGYVVLRSQVGNNPPVITKSTVPMSVNGRLGVILQSHNNITSVRLPGLELKGKSASGMFDSYYIGGIPTDLRKRHNISVPPLRGYVREMNADGKTPTTLKKVGVGRAYGGRMMALRKAEFSVGSSLDSLPTGFSLGGSMTLSLGFKSTEEHGLLLQNQQNNKEIGLAMLNGYVVLKYENRAWKSKKRYQDGKWHYVTVTKQNGRVQLHIDEDSKVEELTQSPTFKFLSSNVTLGANTFTGCMSNVYLRRSDALYQPEDLSTYSQTGKMLLDMCTSDRQPEQMWASRKK